MAHGFRCRPESVGKRAIGEGKCTNEFRATTKGERVSQILRLPDSSGQDVQAKSGRWPRTMASRGQRRSTFSEPVTSGEELGVQSQAEPGGLKQFSLAATPQETGALLCLSP